MHHEQCAYLLQESTIGLGAVAGPYFTSLTSGSNSNYSSNKESRNNSVKKTKTNHRNNTQNNSLSALVAHTGLAVDLENVGPALEVWQTELHLAVQAARA